MPTPRTPAAIVLTALAAAPGLAQTPGPLLATPQRAYMTGDYAAASAFRPVAHAAADLDGDGFPDLAFAHVTNTTAPKISILFNAGDGTYGQPVVLPSLGETTAVAAADLDGDGDIDLAFTQTSEISLSGQRIVVFINNGAGTFSPPSAYPCGRGPMGIIARDLDQDGDTDLATANTRAGENDVSVLLNDGLGGFSARTDFPAGPQPIRIKSADVNRDGRPDLIVANTGVTDRKIHILLNTGAGAFAAPTFLTTAYTSSIAYPGLAAEDIDADGDADILYGAAPGIGELGLGVWKNDGLAHFTPAPPIGTGGYFGGVQGFDFADVTGDAIPDIIGVTLTDTSAWGILRGLGGGAYAQPEIYRAGELPAFMSTADVDADGDRDVIVTSTGSLTVDIAYNDGGFAPPPEAAVNMAMESAAADIDLDGDIDLVSADSLLHTLRNHGDGTFAVTSTSTFQGVFRQVALRDLDHDGYPDLLMTKHSTAGGPPYDLYTARNRHDGTWGTLTRWPLNSCGSFYFTIADFNNDTHPDVAITETLGCPSEPFKRFFILTGRGDGTFNPALVEPLPDSYLNQIVSGDFNNDGRADIAATGYRQVPGAPAPTEGFLIRLGNGDGTFQAPIATGSSPYQRPITLVAAHLDGDEWLDLAGSGFGTYTADDHIVVARGLGDGRLAITDGHPAPFALQFVGSLGAEAFDADHDGDTDLAFAAYGACDAVLFLNNGDATFQPQRRYGVNGRATFIRAADFDGDGAADLAVNLEGAPPALARITILRGSAAGPCPADLTGDGIVDFADYLEFLNRYDALDPSVDFNGDGLVDFADYLEFLNLYEQGC
ncbi:MAG: VCBS repeat-containing protein [Phycisphaerales bacterium]|nr:VCBS repeat-containing protein [Phycisphaerales bacterium]